jgi:hypothetical protein
LLFYTPGLTASNITKVDDNSIKVTISAAADAKTQLHPFRVITASGTSNMRLFGVSALPTVAEVEPNSEFAKAQEAVKQDVSKQAVAAAPAEVRAAASPSVRECMQNQAQGVKAGGWQAGVKPTTPRPAVHH